MNEIILMRGLPASGKSTLAQELCGSTGYAYVNRDSIRYSLYRKYSGLSWEQEKSIAFAILRGTDYRKIALKAVEPVGASM